MKASEYQSKAAIAGRLAEEFVKDRWGIEENGEFEVKATSDRNNQVVLKAVQLLASGPKFFVIVRYSRKRRTLTRGPRKGRRVIDETIGEGFKKRLDVFVVRGFDLLEVISREKRTLLKTKVLNDGEWAFYWTVRIRSLTGELTSLFEDERVRVFGKPFDPPKFLVNLVEREKVPF